MRKESMISTIAVVIIGLIQLATFSFYDVLLKVFSYCAERNPSDQDTNVIGWLYVSVQLGIRDFLDIQSTFNQTFLKHLEYSAEH